MKYSSGTKALKALHYVTLMVKSVGAPLFLTDDWQGKDELFFLRLMKELGEYNDISIAIRLIADHGRHVYKGQVPAAMEVLYKKWSNEKLTNHQWLIEKLKTRVFPELAPMVGRY